MERERERSRCRERLERLADAHLGDEEARREAVAALRRAVRFERWCWPLSDPDSGLATNGIGEVDFWPSLPRLVALEEHGDVTSKPRLAAAPRPSMALSAATGGNLARSPRWLDCLSPYGIGDELMTICRDRHGSWGSLELLRDSDDAPFAEDDACFLGELAPLLGTLVRRSLARGGTHATEETSSPPPPATLLLDGELRPVSWTASFRAWLGELPSADGPPAIPPAVYQIGARALAPGGEFDGLPNRVRIRMRGGRWAVIEGAALEGAEPPGVAVGVRPATSEETFDLLCKTYDLSARERQLVALVLDGLATKELACALFISPYTVQDHLKSVFAKTGTRTRGELVARLAR